MKMDVNYSHSKNIGEPVGDFCGIPTLSYNELDLELDAAIDAQKTILRNRAMGCNDAPSTAEILPGEMLCTDNLIRRETASEVTGHGKYSAGNAYGSEKLADLCALYSVMTSAENLRGFKSQSTPEELCAWLNDMPKRSFMLSVMTEGDDKIVHATSKAGILLYSFRYVGGLPGTYIGGDEVRPFEPPQTKQRSTSDSRVVECVVPKVEETPKEPVEMKAYADVEMKEYADEWISKYVPTSHVERITVGGTAFFAPEEENK